MATNLLFYFTTSQFQGMEKNRLSSLDASVLLNQINMKYHKYYINNLYNSEIFRPLLYASKNKVMAHCVTRKYNRGIPQIIKQERMK